VALGYLIGGWPPATYLAITLVWALPPIGLQLIFGADILWRHIRLVLLTIIPMTIYLSAADSLAITSGTWTIDPDQSTGIFLGSLPIEEAIFFLLTNMIKDACEKNYHCWGQLQEWEQANLIEIASHGVYHPDYRTLSQAGRRWDAKESKRLIEAKKTMRATRIGNPAWLRDKVFYEIKRDA